MITNIQIQKIDLRVFDVNFSSVNIAHNINIKNPRIISHLTPFGEKDVLHIDFQININYVSPALGYMLFEGIIDYFNTDIKYKDIITDWNKNEISSCSIPIRNEVANTLIADIIPFAILISQKVRLPPAINLPKINFEKLEHPQSQISAISAYQ